MAAIASVNLGLVLFDLSYVPYRDFYLRRFCLTPSVCFQLPSSWHQYYDKKKGIEPHTETETYLQMVETLKAQVEKTGLDSPKIEPILAELRQMSSQMIEENPFQIANKTGTLEKIKNLIRDRMGNESSRQSFNEFWNSRFLTSENWQQEIEFFDRTIKPLLESNYYRKYDESGRIVNRFWQLDISFNIIFFFDFLVVTKRISRQNIGVRWIPHAMLWRWYDVFLFLPFSAPLPLMNPLLGWLRVIPVVLRLEQAHLVNFTPIWERINQVVVANFAGALTEIVIVQTIDQVQAVIKNDFGDWLSNSVEKQYIDLNNINEIEVILSRLVKISIYQVLPKLKPDIENLLRYAVNKGLTGIPIYQHLDKIPSMGNVSKNLTEQLADRMFQNLYELLTASIEDARGAKLTSQLIQRFNEALVSELKESVNLQDIQILMCEFLEEVKINYVKRLEEGDIEQLMAETKRLHQGRR